MRLYKTYDFRGIKGFKLGWSLFGPFKIRHYQTYVWGKATPLTMEPFPQRIRTALGNLEPVYTPGHSKDHTSYFLKDAGILFLEELYGSIIVLWEKGYSEKQIFKALNLKEDYMIKYFCFGNVSMINGVRSAVRHYETNKG